MASDIIERWKAST